MIYSYSDISSPKDNTNAAMDEVLQELAELSGNVTTDKSKIASEETKEISVSNTSVMEKVEVLSVKNSVSSVIESVSEVLCMDKEIVENDTADINETSSNNDNVDQQISFCIQDQGISHSEPKNLKKSEQSTTLVDDTMEHFKEVFLKTEETVSSSDGRRNEINQDNVTNDEKFLVTGSEDLTNVDKGVNEKTDDEKDYVDGIESQFIQEQSECNIETTDTEKSVELLEIDIPPGNNSGEGFGENLSEENLQEQRNNPNCDIENIEDKTEQKMETDNSTKDDDTIIVSNESENNITENDPIFVKIDGESSTKSSALSESENSQDVTLCHKEQDTNINTSFNDKLKTASSDALDLDEIPTEIQTSIISIESTAITADDGIVSGATPSETKVDEIQAEIQGSATLDDSYSTPTCNVSDTPHQLDIGEAQTEIEASLILDQSSSVTANIDVVCDVTTDGRDVDEDNTEITVSDILSENNSSEADGAVVSDITPCECEIDESQTKIKPPITPDESNSGDDIDAKLNGDDAHIEKETSLITDQTNFTVVDDEAVSDATPVTRDQAQIEIQISVSPDESNSTAACREVVSDSTPGGCNINEEMTEIQVSPTPVENDFNVVFDEVVSNVAPLECNINEAVAELQTSVTPVENNFNVAGDNAVPDAISLGHDIVLEDQSGIQVSFNVDESKSPGAQIMSDETPSGCDIDELDKEIQVPVTPDESKSSTAYDSIAAVDENTATVEGDAAMSDATAVQTDDEEQTEMQTSASPYESITTHAAVISNTSVSIDQNPEERPTSSDPDESISTAADDVADLNRQTVIDELSKEQNDQVMEYSKVDSFEPIKDSVKINETSASAISTNEKDEKVDEDGSGVVEYANNGKFEGDVANLPKAAQDFSETTADVASLECDKPESDLSSNIQDYVERDHTEVEQNSEVDNEHSEANALLTENEQGVNNPKEPVSQDDNRNSEINLESVASSLESHTKNENYVIDRVVVEYIEPESTQNNEGVEEKNPETCEELIEKSEETVEKTCNDEKEVISDNEHLVTDDISKFAEPNREISETVPAENEFNNFIATDDIILDNMIQDDVVLSEPETKTETAVQMLEESTEEESSKDKQTETQDIPIVKPIMELDDLNKPLETNLKDNCLEDKVLSIDKSIDFPKELKIASITLCEDLSENSATEEIEEVVKREKLNVNEGATISDEIIEEKVITEQLTEETTEISDICNKNKTEDQTVIEENGAKFDQLKSPSEVSEEDCVPTLVLDVDDENVDNSDPSDVVDQEMNNQKSVDDLETVSSSIKESEEEVITIRQEVSSALDIYKNSEEDLLPAAGDEIKQTESELQPEMEMCKDNIKSSQHDSIDIQKESSDANAEESNIEKRSDVTEISTSSGLNEKISPNDQFNDMISVEIAAQSVDGPQSEAKLGELKRICVLRICA